MDRDSAVTVVTANRRQALILRQTHDTEQIHQGRTCWPAADVLPWAAWVQRLCDEALLQPGAEPAPLWLTAAEERWWWEQVIEEQRGERALLRTEPAARLAMDAWRLAQEWGIEPELGRSGGEDARLFALWATAFRRRCASAGRDSTSGQVHHLVRCLGAGALEPPRALRLAGFDGFSPGQQALLDALTAAGCELSEEPPVAQSATVLAADYGDPQLEIEAAARWARALLDEGAAGPIGIVVPGLDGLRDVLERTLAAILDPPGTLPGADPAPLFNLSLGRPLAQYPVVADALSLLALAAGEVLPTTTLGRLLRSPYLAGSEEEFAARARLDAALLDWGRPEFGMAGVGAALEGGAAEAATLAERISTVRREVGEWPGRASPSAWASRFGALLQAFGWPRGRALNSAEYQGAEAFGEALAALGRLDRVAGAIGQRLALRELRRAARETIFQPRAAAAPVQVLGVLEASGLRFSHLWLLGFHYESWPPAARPNPLLPLAAQRAVGVPHSSPAQELEFATRLSGRLLGAAPEVVLSWPRTDGERELQPSPLLAASAGARPADPRRSAVADLAQAGMGGTRLEPIFDEAGPPLPPGSSARGGAAVLRDQAACPFRAFAMHRLQARPLGEVGPGFAAAERGSLVHDVLEGFWRETEDSAGLAQLDAAGLAGRVQHHAEAALRRRAPGPRGGAPRRFLELELERIGTLLCAWLELERERPPFRVVATEREQAVELVGLHLQARIDRIDELREGERLVLDYKTGQASKRAWLEPRPDEPQLPLYALGQAEPPAGIAFAVLRPGELGFAGLARSEGLAPGVTAWSPRPGVDEPADWDALMGAWRERLEALAVEFLAGDARVAPKAYPQTCRYCPLPLLCRIHDGQRPGRGED